MFKFFEYNTRDKIIMCITITSFYIYVYYYHFYTTQCPNYFDWNMCSPIFLPLELLDIFLFVLSIPVIPWMAGQDNSPIWVTIYVWSVSFIIITMLAIITAKFIIKIISKFQKKDQRKEEDILDV